MMNPLNYDARSQGGLNRDKNRLPWEKDFMATLAATSRPLKRDNAISEDPAGVVEMLEREGKRFPWIEFVAVGVDGRTVRKAVPPDIAKVRVSKMGGCVGFAGILWFNKRLCVFMRPLKAGPKAQELLTATATKLETFAEEFIRQELAERMGKTK
jgi:hypothetical protein